MDRQGMEWLGKESIQRQKIATTGREKMKEIRVEISGRMPLLTNRFTDERQMSATSGTRSSIATDDKTPAEQAEESLYKSEEDGEPGIPGPNILRCLIDAGTYLKVGRSKVSTQKTSLVPAAVMLEEPFVPIQTESGWKVDTRPVRIPATGGRILRHRACFDDWRIAFTVILDEKIITEKLFRELVDIAGSHIGLGDFRPATKGPFGRFVVDHWSVKASS